MSFILNALKKAENKSLETDNVKVKKQILVLKKRSRGGRLKLFFFAVTFLGTLLVGWLFGYLQSGQTGNDAVVVISDNVFEQKQHPLGNPPAENVNISSESMVAGKLEEGENSNAPRNREKISEANVIIPPIPVMTKAKKVTPEQEKTGEKQPELTRPMTEVIPIQNYLDMPFSVREDLPPLKMSLHFYNSISSRRIVRINGKNLHENESIEEGLVIREIKPTTAVLAYDGYLFELDAPGK